jgi:hypothetical protein
VRQNFLRACVALALVAMPCLAFAQDEKQPERPQRQRGQGGPGGFGGGFGGPGGFGGGPGGGGNRNSKLMLVGLEPVQKELEISDEQLASLKTIRDEATAEQRSQFEGFRGLRDLPEEERRTKLEELRKSAEENAKKMQEKLSVIEKKALDVLLPPQRDRLEQISIQVRGLAALQDEEVAKKLGISEEQKSKMTTIRDESRKKMEELFGRREGAERPSREEFQKRMEEAQAARKTVESDTLNVLTDDQKAQFEKMKGEKFEMPQGRGGFGGPGGQGQRGQGGERGRPQPKAD